MHFQGRSSASTSVITVSSALNYCGSYKNKDVVILIENDKMNPIMAEQLSVDKTPASIGALMQRRNIKLAQEEQEVQIHHSY